MLFLISDIACMIAAIICLFQFNFPSFESIVCFGIFVCASILNEIGYLLEKIHNNILKNKT
jgi:hypothetical protein